MQFTFSLMNKADIQALQSWRYDGEYAVYDIHVNPDDDSSEMLDRRSPYYAVRDEQGELMGFFNFGTSAQVWDNDHPGVYSENGIVDIGLGLRPDLTGKGLGLAFVEAGLAFAKEQFALTAFRLFVLAFNERAIRVYERAGFERVRVFVQQNIHGEHRFVEMRREA